ncbi:putative phosphohistidine phosphatase, SixA [Gluconacetobacter diazotrophicus PA1 5]|uniref:Phosphoglycerate mutase n=2 Tax=Gluconacetobacter diazotrophicus TaxID=33996 RepID=A0A7W4FDT8_GLUDI|nr:histidine phosphatase family protein [Gluconacetobacter diazotrophicus]ACI49861.1 putative phosphohistidine phosphatase, SixA [Gluconacetobacter diazotrophicus PA1 5]MBB2155812.1 phosphoglycerate mutase [Gluconacetobacter diazotrophicus]TWB10290.1 phosphohistidine phosphatase [Gluconacetobacter diazotrophicus]CAP55774.1 putative phosphoglycerate mutase [Gluconacetobacter diazotrophicus PA1 5]
MPRPPKADGNAAARRTLVLMRHAEAFPARHGDPGPSGDLERPLTPSGRRKAHERGTQLREIGFVPDLVLISPARRSGETYAALGPFSTTDAPHVRQEAGLYEAGAGSILEILREIPETASNIIVVGHNPDLYHLVLDLAGDAIDDPDKTILNRGFPTASAAWFTVEGPWHELARRRVALARVLCT